MVFLMAPSRVPWAPAWSVYISRVSLPVGVFLGLKYSAVTVTYAFWAYSCFTRSFLTMSTAMFSRPDTGFSVLSSATALRTSTFLERWDPLCAAGRSTKMSMEQFTTLLRGLLIPGLAMRTGLRTPETPTLVSLKPVEPLLYCTSHFNAMLYV